MFVPWNCEALRGQWCLKFCSSSNSESDLQEQEVGAEKQEVKVGIKAGTFLGRRERTQSKWISFFPQFTFVCFWMFKSDFTLIFLKQSFQGFCYFNQSLYQLHCLQGSCNQGEKQLKLITMGEVPRVKVPTHPPTFQTAKRGLHVQRRKLGSATRGIRLIN